MTSLREWVSTEKKAGLRTASSDTPTFKLESGRWWRTSKQEWEDRKLKENQKHMVLVGVENGHLFQMILKVKFKKD